MIEFGERNFHLKISSDQSRIIRILDRWGVITHDDVWCSRVCRLFWDPRRNIDVNPHRWPRSSFRTLLSTRRCRIPKTCRIHDRWMLVSGCGWGWSQEGRCLYLVLTSCTAIHFIASNGSRFRRLVPSSNLQLWFEFGVVVLPSYKRLSRSLSRHSVAVGVPRWWLCLQDMSRFVDDS